MLGIAKRESRILSLRGEAEAIKRHRIPRKSAHKAMAKPQHSAALEIAIFDSPLLTNVRIPNKIANNPQ